LGVLCHFGSRCPPRGFSFSLRRRLGLGPGCCMLGRCSEQQPGPAPSPPPPHGAVSGFGGGGGVRGVGGSPPPFSSLTGLLIWGSYARAARPDRLLQGAGRGLGAGPGLHGLREASQDQSPGTADSKGDFGTRCGPPRTWLRRPRTSPRSSRSAAGLSARPRRHACGHGSPHPKVTGKRPGYLSPPVGREITDVPRDLGAIPKVPAAGG
jgi:hypothetical protein